MSNGNKRVKKSRDESENDEGDVDMSHESNEEMNEESTAESSGESISESKVSFTSFQMK